MTEPKYIHPFDVFVMLNKPDAPAIVNTGRFVPVVCCAGTKQEYTVQNEVLEIAGIPHISSTSVMPETKEGLSMLANAAANS